MRKSVPAICVAAAAVGSVLLLGGPGVAAAAPAPGAQLWSSSYNGSVSFEDRAFAAAVSPDGSTVFVTGRSDNTGDGDDYTTAAYNAATGAQEWASLYDHQGQEDVAVAIAVSPADGAVYVTGFSDGDYATVAYNAATGAQMWASRYNGTGNGEDVAKALAVSPNGRTVFVTGSSPSPAGDLDYATVAYVAATGRQLWVSRYNGPGDSTDTARSIAVSPQGQSVYVTGGSNGRRSSADYATIAYSAATGKTLWIQRYDFDRRTDTARQIVVSPNGATVFVTGQSRDSRNTYDYATLAYNAATGARVWVRRYNGPANGSDIASSIAVSPRNGAVFVTGTSEGKTSGLDFATVAYGTNKGAQLWVRRYSSPSTCDDFATSVAVSPRGTKLYVAGYIVDAFPAKCSSGFAVVSYTTTGGLRRWSATGPAESVAYSVAVNPVRNAVYIAGATNGGASNFDMLTAALQS